MVRDLDDILRPFAQERGIGLINASPLHLRILTPAGATGWHPAPPEVKETGRKVVEFCRSRGLSAPTVGLRFCLDYPHVTSTLVGIQTRQQLQENLAVLDYQNDPLVLQEIEKIIAPVKNRTWPSGRPENHD
jgi:L-galactose dehydrogenase